MTSQNLLKYGLAIIIASPGNKLAKCVRKIREINEKYTLDIKQIMLNNCLTNEERLELLKLKVESGLKQYKGAKRALFLKTLLALTVFLLGNSTPIFTYLIRLLRQLLGKSDEETFREHLIELYYEYNAPLSEDLVTKVAEHL